MFKPLMSAKRVIGPFQMEYKVKDSDSLERIAAQYETTVGELMKINRLGSRMVFPGQTIVVPSPMSDEVFEESKEDDGIRRGPGTAVPLRPSSDVSPSQPTSATDSSPGIPKKLALDADADCLQRFLKIKVKQVTEKDGTVSGTLLVTPNALMFDPDVSHPLVKENGQELYMMMANMDEIASVAVFKDIGALTGEKDKKEKMYDPAHVRKDRDSSESSATENGRTKSEGITSPRIELGDSSSDISSEADQRDSISSRLGGFGGSDSQLPRIMEEEQKTFGAELEVPISSRRTYSDVGFETSTRQESSSFEKKKSAPSAGDSMKGDRKRADSDIMSSSSNSSGKKSGKEKRHSFALLGRTFSSKANSMKGSAGKITQSAVSGTKTVAHGMITHTKSAADTLSQTGLAKMAATHAKVAVDAMVSMPQGLMMMGTGLFAEGQHAIGDAINAAKDTKAVASVRRNQSLATLETLKQKTQQAREQAARDRQAALAAERVARAKRGYKSSRVESIDVRPRAHLKQKFATERGQSFTCATTPEDKPDLFRPLQELLTNVRKLSDLPEPTLITELPYYMAVRLSRKKTRVRTIRSTSVSGSGSVSSSVFEEDTGGNRVRREFWFAVPKHRAGDIYYFLLQWNPDKYGEDVSVPNSEETAGQEDSGASNVSGYRFGDNSFLVLDSQVDEKLAGEKPANELFGSSYLNREWEIVAVQEMCRRLSLDRLDQLILPIPDGATSSQILDEPMIRQIMEILPARAESYPWVNIYNSEKHGFSLITLYRKMTEWDEEMSPILLIIRDINGGVFGAITSSALLPCEHYVGTGDSCLLFKFAIDPQSKEKELRSFTWTGENQYFVKASKDSISMGAGGGHYGLWLDADLNHGRSMRCETFDNEPLSSEEDFSVQFLEAYGFRMG